MKTTKSIVFWVALAVLALTFTSTAFAGTGGTGGGDGLGWLRHLVRAVAEALGQIFH